MRTVSFVDKLVTLFKVIHSFKGQVDVKSATWSAHFWKKYPRTAWRWLDECWHFTACDIWLQWNCTLQGFVSQVIGHLWFGQLQQWVESYWASYLRLWMFNRDGQVCTFPPASCHCTVNSIQGSTDMFWTVQVVSIKSPCPLNTLEFKMLASRR